MTRGHLLKAAGTVALAVGLAAFAQVRTVVGTADKTAAEDENGRLALSLIDADSQRTTPARVEIQDENGVSYVSPDAIPFGSDCRNAPAAWKGNLGQARALLFRRFFDNNYTGTRQFYSGGQSTVPLPAGKYHLKAIKGPEYRVTEAEILIEPGKTATVSLRLTRWINPPKEGWYSADGHLHIIRPRRELDPDLSKWMQAEDIHFANLLEWGHSAGFHNARQYAEGRDGIYRDGDYFLAPGQENPRTHILGHTITLGARSRINVPDKYLIYRLAFEEARRQGALSGYAHYGKMEGAQFGLSLDLTYDLLSFIEVLQIDAGEYDVWYDVLNTGFQIAPIAGTDYPCLRTIPGRERFYAKVNGTLSYDSWLEAIRSGRTFVTNGPMLEMTVNDREIGETIAVTKPGRVKVRGRVRFDDTRDDVTTLEVIKNGEVLARIPRTGSSEIRCEVSDKVDGAAWYALRASGSKLNEYKNPPALAHTGAIYVSVQGGRLATTSKGKELAQAWIARLDELEKQVVGGTLPKVRKGVSDGVTPSYIESNRADLLNAIRASKDRFAARIR